MAEPIKIPPPSLPREPANKIESIKDQPFVSDTSKVIKPNDKDKLTQTKSDNSTSFNYQSISARTMRLLSSSETATQALKRLLFNDEIFGLMKSGTPEGLKVSNFLNSFFLSLEQLPAYLQTQISNASLFQGDFFDALRQLLSQTPANSQIYNASMQLLKGLEAFKNQKSTLTFLQYNLNNLLPYLSKSDQQAMIQILSQLDQPNSADQLNTLRRSILDILGDTASRHKDNQTLRNMIMLSVHNLARLDHSDQDSLSKLFNQLSTILQQYSKLRSDQLEHLQNAFQKQLQQGSASHAAADQVLQALDQGLSADSPLAVQLASSNLLSSLLLNHSVLLPLVYGFIPLRLEDDYLFSELWAYVEEDSEGSASNSQPTVKLFFTLESTVFGFFQGLLQGSGKKISLSLEAPEMALPFLQGMGEHLVPIFQNLGYQLTETDITPLVAPKKFYDVFGKKILREAYLNVQV